MAQLSKTYQLGYRVVPSPEHPDADRLGEGFTVCWIVAASLELADSLANEDIAAQHWRVLEREYGYHATRDDFDDDDDELEYFEQAQLDGEVYMYHLSPRFSVFRVVALVQRVGEDGRVETAEAQFFVLNEVVMDEDDDAYDPEFWNDIRSLGAVASARQHIAAAGWSVEHVTSAAAVDWLTDDSALRDDCDRAEDTGVYLAIRARA